LEHLEEKRKLKGLVVGVVKRSVKRKQ